jgi:hypothetical protein
MPRLKIFFLILLFSISKYAAFSQFIGITGGVALPSGSFGSKNISAGTSAFALPGPMYQLMFAYKPQNYFIGFSASARGQSNAVDVHSMNSQMAAGWTAKSGSWKTNYFMIGTYSPFLSNSGRGGFHLKFMIGAASSNMPEITLSGEQNGVPYWKKRGASSALSVAYLMNVGFKYNLSERLCLLFNFDYIGTSPQFKNITYSDSNNMIGPHDLTQNINNYNFSAGVGIKLGN